MYLLLLIVLAQACMFAALWGVRAWLDIPPPPAERARPPWWLFVVGLPVVLGIAICSAWLLDLLLRWIEYVAFFRRKCPACSGRRWSRGFTRGFGL